MTVRRRSRNRPLTEFARRSPIHAVTVWLFRSSIIAALILATYLLIAGVLVPGMVEAFLA
jgi:hypothetical protein